MASSKVSCVGVLLSRSSGFGGQYLSISNFYNKKRTNHTHREQETNKEIILSAELFFAIIQNISWWWDVEAVHGEM